MKLLSLLTLSLLFLQTAPNSPGTRTGTGTVEGVVTRLGPGQPVGGARVTLTRIGDLQVTALPPDLRAPEDVPPARPVPPVLTDDKGRFTIRAEEGLYALQVQANGYVSRMYGRRSADEFGMPIVVTAGQITGVCVAAERKTGKLNLDNG
jgi:hypothetical protein